MDKYLLQMPIWNNDDTLNRPGISKPDNSSLKIIHSKSISLRSIKRLFVYPPLTDFLASEIRQLSEKNPLFWGFLVDSREIREVIEFSAILTSLPFNNLIVNQTLHGTPHDINLLVTSQLLSWNYVLAYHNLLKTMLIYYLVFRCIN